MPIDLDTFLISASYVGIFLMLGAETGLLIGFFLPGDSLLVTAGILAADGKLSLPGVMLSGFLGAVLGDSMGYAVGRKAGKKLFRRKKSRFFNPRNVQRARDYFERHGAKTLVIARFVPMLRTFAPTVSGVGEMAYPRFLGFNVVGGVLWAVGLPLVSYYLGRQIPHLDRYLYQVLGGVIVISLIPAAWELWRSRHNDDDDE